MRIQLLFLTVLLLIAGFSIPSFAQIIIDHKTVNAVDIDLMNTEVLEQINLTNTTPGKAVVRFDGTCISDAGDVIVLAASNTMNWNSDDGRTQVEAIDGDINRNSFSHSRLYDLAPGSHDFYAVAQNFYETDGNGLATIHGNFTVEFYPDGYIASESLGIVEEDIDLSSITTLGEITINPSTAGEVFVRFDGYCLSDVGDRILFAANNVPSWGTNDGNVSVEAYTADLNSNTFAHTRHYNISAGSHTFYAVGYNFPETAGNGLASVFGNLTVEFIPASLGSTTENNGISASNLDLTTLNVLDQIDITIADAGTAVLRFNGTCTSSPGDRINLAVNDIQDWAIEDGHVSVESVDFDVNRSGFSHTRVYELMPGSHSFYAVAENVDETDGSGIASVYANFSLSFYPEGSGSTSGVVEDWLIQHPAVADEITWNFDKTSYDVRSYFNWDTDDKEYLQSLYDDIEMGNYPSFTDPVNNLLADTTSFAFTVVSESDAYSIYFSYLAVSLFHEINSSFNWSITTFDQDALATLYNWTEYFTVNTNDFTGNNPEFMVWIRSTPAPPDYLKTQFIEAYDIIDSSAHKTYGRILDFARDSMLHYSGSITASNANAHWQYYGQPPMSRVIDGTTRSINDQFGHWTAGCHGTVNFTQWLGFYLNIPVIDDYKAGHRIAVLPSIDSSFITHGDDPYSQGSKDPKIEGRHLVVDGQHFDDYFVDGNSMDWLNNIGNRVNEIAFNILPEAYLNAYCNDYDNNGNLEEANYLANNYAGLNTSFSAEFMDSIHFWDRLHLKLIQDNYPCFESYNAPVNYEAHAIIWDSLDNAQVNIDSSIYKVDNEMPMSGRSLTCLGVDSWVEMVLYNSKPMAWIGLSLADDSVLEEMTYALMVEDNVYSVYEDGVLITTIQDTFNHSVNWFRLERSADNIKYILNGFVKYQHSLTDPGLKLNVHFGAEGEDAEINNVYSSTSNTAGCCTPDYDLSSSPILDGVYHAQNSITASSIIPANGDVEFLSGGQIELNNGFEVEAGAVFNALIGECP